KNSDRAVRGETAIEEGLAQAANFLERFAIGEIAPLAVSPALRCEGTLRRHSRPVNQALGENAGIGAERLVWPDDDRAVRAALHRGARTSQANRAHGRVEFRFPRDRCVFHQWTPEDDYRIVTRRRFRALAFRLHAGSGE